MPKEQLLVVTTSPDRSIDAIALDLEKAGFVVEHVLEAIGSITGRSSPASIARLEAIDGVTDVSPSTDVGIGPPDGDVTW